MTWHKVPSTPSSLPLPCCHPSPPHSTLFCGQPSPVIKFPSTLKSNTSCYHRTLPLSHWQHRLALWEENTKKKTAFKHSDKQHSRTLFLLLPFSVSSPNSGVPPQDLLLLCSVYIVIQQGEGPFPSPPPLPHSFRSSKK